MRKGKKEKYGQQVTHNYSTMLVAAMMTTSLYPCTLHCTMRGLQYVDSTYLFCPFALPLLIRIPPLQLLKALGDDGLLFDLQLHNKIKHCP